jgi:hypothetical protein
MEDAHIVYRNLPRILPISLYIYPILIELKVSMASGAAVLG